MTTALAVSVVAERQALFEAELRRIRKFYADNPSALEPVGGLDTYVRLCFQRHAPLLRHWGEWWSSFHGKNILVDQEEISNTLERVSAQWQQGFHTKKTTHPPLRFLQNSVTELTQKFCDLFGCHMPPVADERIFVTRVWQHADEDIEVAAGITVKLRKGQAPSRVVLAAVKKRYPDNPTYLAYWQNLFEVMGVLWASAKPAEFRLTAAPSDFLRLGDVGENNSCYATGNTFEKARLYLAQIPNSVVLFVYRGSKIIGRAWGILAPKAGGAEFTNFYLTPRETLLPGLKLAVQHALQLSVPVEEADTGLDLSESYAYLNGDEVLLAPKGKERAVRDEIKVALSKFEADHQDVESRDEEYDDEY